MTGSVLHNELGRRGLGAFVGFRGESPIFTSVRDALLILGPPGSGKSTRFFAQSVACFPGLVVSTTCRSIHSLHPDVAELTVGMRRTLAEQTNGRVIELQVDEQMPSVASSVSWDVLEGCEIWQEAVERATTLAFAGIRPDAVDNAAFFRSQSIALLSPLLYAFARAGRTMWDLVSAVQMGRVWPESNDDRTFSLDGLARRLARDPSVGPFHPATLNLSSFCSRDKMTPETRANIFSVVNSQVLSMWNRNLIRPPQQVRIADLMTGTSTVYIQTREDFADSSAAYVSAFIQALTSRWRTLASDSRPPSMLLALDEVANVAPLHSLPGLMATAGGDGIQVMIGVQDVDRIRTRWPDGGQSILRNGNLVLLGGYRNAEFLADISSLLPQDLRRHEAWVARSSSTSLGLARRDIEEIAGTLDGVSASGTSPVARINLRMAEHEARIAAYGAGVRLTGKASTALARELMGHVDREDQFKLQSDITADELFGLPDGSCLVLMRNDYGILECPGWWESSYWQHILSGR